MNGGNQPKHTQAHIAHSSTYYTILLEKVKWGHGGWPFTDADVPMHWYSDAETRGIEREKGRGGDEKCIGETA
jgi:hypothetical protein